MDLHQLRSLFGLVLQDASVQRHVADNIRLGRPLPDEAVRRAASVHDPISSSASRPATRLRWPSAAPRSVGQKQLLSFARALAFDRGSSSSTKRHRAWIRDGNPDPRRTAEC